MFNMGTAGILYPLVGAGAATMAARRAARSSPNSPRNLSRPQAPGAETRCVLNDCGSSE